MDTVKDTPDPRCPECGRVVEQKIYMRYGQVYVWFCKWCNNGEGAYWGRVDVFDPPYVPPYKQYYPLSFKNDYLARVDKLTPTI